MLLRAVYWVISIIGLGLVVYVASESNPQSLADPLNAVALTVLGCAGLGVAIVGFIAACDEPTFDTSSTED